MKTVNVNKLLKKIETIYVPLAEFEYLYDPNIKNEGQIDPNALSAGGFPSFILGSIMDHIYNKRVLHPASCYIGNDTKNYLEKSLIETFGKRINSNHFGDLILRSLNKYITDDIDFNFVKKLIIDLKDAYSLAVSSKIDPSLENPSSFLTKVFQNEQTISFLGESYWVAHRMNLVADFYKIKNSGRGIGPFSNNLLRDVDQFLTHFTEASGFFDSKIIDFSQPFNSYSVYWSSYLSYFIKYKLNERFPELQTNVWLDVHANTGVVSLKPSQTYVSIFSKKKAEVFYQLVRSLKLKKIADKVKKADKKYPTITKGKQCFRLTFNAKQELDLVGIKLVEDTLTDNIHQEAYLLNFFPKSKLKIDNYFHQEVVLSSLLNAKAALFEIYRDESKKHHLQIRSPFTLTFNKKLPGPKLVTSKIKTDFVVVKEGGRCSTGGEEVDIVSKKLLKIADLRKYITTVVQDFVPSQIFSINGKPVHSHLRRIAVLTKEKNVFSLGYIFKIAFRKNLNSSSFVTISVYYDNDYNFVIGKFSGSKSTEFYDMKKNGLKLNLNKSQFIDFIKRSCKDWELSIFYLNDYFQRNFKGRVNRLVDEGFVTQLYHLE